MTQSSWLMQCTYIEWIVSLGSYTVVLCRFLWCFIFCKWQWRDTGSGPYSSLRSFLYRAAQKHLQLSVYVERRVTVYTRWCWDSMCLGFLFIHTAVQVQDRYCIIIYFIRTSSYDAATFLSRFLLCMIQRLICLNEDQAATYWAILNVYLLCIYVSFFLFFIHLFFHLHFVYISLTLSSDSVANQP